MTAEKLAEILRKHKLWLNNEAGGERAGLSYADLRHADLSSADLRHADLRHADLRHADLSSADLRHADLRHADLSSATGILPTVNFLESYFERTEAGYIAYKTFNSQFKAPDSWKLEPGSVIEENVNFNRCEDCGCGINVAPLEWVKKNYQGDIWKVLIRWEWLCGVCVPFNSGGKIRCERVKLLEVVRR